MVSSLRTAAVGMLGFALIVGLAACAGPEASEPTASAPTPSESPAPVAPVPVEPEFDRTAHSIDDPASLWVVSNKLRPLNPVDFAPPDLVMPEGVENEFTQPLREPAARAIEQLVQGASAAGLQLRIISAYRPYATQVALYNGYVARDGQAAADTYSARPGHSEHQTGLAVDLDDFSGCYLAVCFAQTPAGAWVAEHAAEYGFVIRYPDGAEGITGFMFEPWHLRFVGVELAAEMRASGTATLEEFFGLPAAPGYA